MPTLFYQGSDIERIIGILPVGEITHMRYVESYVELLARETFLKNGDKDAFKTKHRYFGAAAFYHDIGKSQVPREILVKRGKLTKKEKYIIVKHPLFAEEIFMQIRNGSVSGMPKCLVKYAADAAMYHHERWDGRGYPYGMKYTEIPLIARMVMVCDAYDAMTSKRLYKDAQSHEYACQQLMENSGSQFDPMIVQIFLANEKKFEVLKEVGKKPGRSLARASST